MTKAMIWLNTMVVFTALLPIFLLIWVLMPERGLFTGMWREIRESEAMLWRGAR